MPNNVVGFKINGSTYEYDHDHLANLPDIDATPTANSTNAVQSGGVKTALEAVQAEIPVVDPVPTQGSTNAVSSGGMYEALQNVDVVEYQVSPAWFSNGYINLTGVFVTSNTSDWTYTPFYKIPDSSNKIRLSVYARGTALGVAFYDGTATFISGEQIGKKTNTDLAEYDIPTNAVFVRFTNSVGENYHPDTPLIILLRNKTTTILEDKKESKYKQLTWRKGKHVSGSYATSDIRMCTVEPFIVDKPVRISLATDWRVWVSYYKDGTWIRNGALGQYDGYIPESEYEIYITLGKRDDSAITDEELATASESIAVILTDKYEEARKAEQYAPNWASVSLFQKIGVLGDSFASGSLHNPDGTYVKTNYAVSWGQILARDIGASVTNYSKGGLSATQWLSDTEYGLEKLLSSDPEQLYICDFGINDWNQRETYPIGTIADCKEDYSENPETFYGSYGKIIGNIIDHAPDAKIVILSVMRRTERQLDGDIETIAEHFGLPFIKLTDDDFFVSEFYAQSIYGNHPVAYGYAGIAEAVKRLLCKCIMKNTDYFRTYYG